jgi:hypothetical protein
MIGCGTTPPVDGGKERLKFSIADACCFDTTIL